jgi:hypothetical protein
MAPIQKDHPLFSSGTPFSNTQTTFERTKIWSWIPTGPETMNDCAGEDQQLFAGPGLNCSPNFLFTFICYVRQSYLQPFHIKVTLSLCLTN